MEQETSGQKENPTNETVSSENKRMEIEINKYKQLVDAINNPRLLTKIIAVIAIIVVLIFLGISLVSLMLKKFYPYKSISTIQSGATIIENEDTEVIYWLFNSADLWSNSGIKVEEGDIITVRASGAFHTAIHHAVEDANNNNAFRDDWIRPMGGRNLNIPRDTSRMSYRIMPHATDNILLMQVIPDDYRNTGKDWLKKGETSTMGFLDGGINWDEKKGKDSSDVNIIIIGEEKRDIRIPRDGILHFAVNDIVLTERIMTKMQDRARIEWNKKKSQYCDTSKLELGLFPIPHNKEELQNVINYLRDTSSQSRNRITKQRYKHGYNLGVDINSLIRIRDKWDSNSSADSNLKRIIEQNLTELDYYRMTKFVDAWFVDNVGSILIAIERKKK